MNNDMPYMASVKNLGSILSKIKSAQTPPKFTHEFLKTHLGFSSSGDRAIIKLLRALGFIDNDGRPSDRYNHFRAENGLSRAIAQGLQEGWSGIFLSNQRANTLSATELKDIFKSVTGKGEAVAEKMATTFYALAKQADFSSLTSNPQRTDAEKSPAEQKDVSVKEIEDVSSQGARATRILSLRNDVHIHLPATSDTTVYVAIFRALKEELLD